MNGLLNLHPKVAGGGLSGSVSLIVLWLLSLAKVNVTPEVAAALTLVLTIAGGYLAPILKKEAAAGTPAKQTTTPPASA